MEERFKVSQWVYSTRLDMAVEILPFYDEKILFSCSIDAANRYKEVYKRLANGNEIFSTLSHRDRAEARFKDLLNKLKDL